MDQENNVSIKDSFKSRNGSWQQPQILSLSQPDQEAVVKKLLDEGNVWSVFDEIKVAIEELYDIKYPEQKDAKSQSQLDEFIAGFGNLDEYGDWVYYPWSGSLVHFPPKADLRALRTSRNRNLITAEEQQRTYEGIILIVGMSVGSNVAEALISQGIGGTLILADMDVLDPSNLNRIRASYQEVGVHKVDVIAKKISEIDPYINQIHYLDGLDADSLDEIIYKYKPNIIVDEMDDVRMKLKLRYRAREAKIPVIMAADDGDNILLDIERYDLHGDLPILHGKVPPQVIDRIMGQDSIPRPELGMLIGKYFVGLENTPLRMFESLAQVGKSLPSWPQLGGAATLAGVTLAYCARRILLGHTLAEGRFVVGPDQQLNPEIQSKEYKDKLATIIERISS